MITFKQFLLNNTKYGYNTVLNEELTDKQKKVVDNWYNKTKRQEVVNNISGHMFENNSDRYSIPLQVNDNTADIKPHPEIEKHLNDNGYTIHNYKEGLAKSSKGQIIKIGKALQKTNAPHLVNLFNSDRSRTGVKQASNSRLKVVISRNPHDVAGMSTNRGWTSCMDMEKGCNAHYLKHDVEHGTHVAYLVHHDDDEIKNPLSRIALKPFHSHDENGQIVHTILRPESSEYGDSDSSFNATVNRHVEEKYPAKEGHVYVKNPNVYHDDEGIEGSDVIGHTKDLLNHTNPYVRAIGAKKTDDVNEIHKAMNDTSRNVKDALTKNPNFNSEHVNVAFNNSDHHLLHSVFKNVNSNLITDDHIMKGLTHENPYVQDSAINHVIKNKGSEFFNDEKTKNILSDKRIGDIVKQKAAIYAKGDNLDLALNHPNNYVRFSALSSPHVEDRHIIKGLQDQHNMPRLKAIQLAQNKSDFSRPDLLKQAQDSKPSFNRPDLSKYGRPSSSY